MKLLSWFFVSTNIQHTSNALVSEKMSTLTDGKFLHFIGLWFLMATVSGFWGVTTSNQKNLMRGKILVHSTSPQAWVSRDLTPSTTNYALLPKLHQTKPTRFGRSVRWFKSGTNTWLLCFVPIGFFIWTKACPFGIVCSHAQAGYFAQGSHIPLKMSITPFVVKKWNSNPDWVGGGHRLPKGDGSSQIQQPRKDCWATPSSAAAVFYVMPLCCAWFWLLGFKRICGAEKTQNFCWCAHQEASLLVILSPW